MELNEQQKEIVTSDQKKIVVEASAGSGKTRVLIERICYLIDNDIYKPEEIVAITFTNMAANEIKYRLPKSAQGVHVGTIHSVANRMLVTAGVDTKGAIQDENFDELFNMVNLHKECTSSYKYLLLDEAHDSSANEFEFIFENLNPEEWMLFFDPKQTIYRYKGAYPDYIRELQDNWEVTTYYLDYNYRCAPSILTYAKNYIARAGSAYYDRSIAIDHGYNGEVIETDSDSDLIKAILESGEYGKWFVLCRTNKEVYAFQAMLDMYNIPSITFKQGNLTNEMLRDRLNSDNVKVLTIHSAKGLEKEYVGVIGARSSNLEEICISYVAYTRAKEKLMVVNKNKYKNRRSSKSTSKFQDMYPEHANKRKMLGFEVW